MCNTPDIDKINDLKRLVWPMDIESDIYRTLLKNVVRSQGRDRAYTQHHCHIFHYGTENYLRGLMEGTTVLMVLMWKARASRCCVFFLTSSFC